MSSWNIREVKVSIWYCLSNRNPSSFNLMFLYHSYSHLYWTYCLPSWQKGYEYSEKNLKKINLYDKELWQWSYHIHSAASKPYSLLHCCFDICKILKLVVNCLFSNYQPGRQNETILVYKYSKEKQLTTFLNTLWSINQFCKQ